MRGRVQRLHRRMRQIRRFVDRIDDLGGARERARRVAAVDGIDERSVERGAIISAEGLAVGRRRLAEVPDDRQRRERLLRAPESVGDHRDAVLDGNDRYETAPILDGGLIETLQLACEY